MVDLCTLTDVKFFGQINGTIYDSRISSMITYKSNEIIHLSQNSALDGTNIDAKYACIYGVLVWLEKEGKIKNQKQKKQISERSDGHVTIQYDNPKIDLTTFNSEDNYEKYMDYLARVLPLGVIGTYDDSGYNDILGYSKTANSSYAVTETSDEVTR